MNQIYPTSISRQDQQLERHPQPSSLKRIMNVLCCCFRSNKVAPTSDAPPIRRTAAEWNVIWANREQEADESSTSSRPSGPGFNESSLSSLTSTPSV